MPPFGREDEYLIQPGPVGAKYLGMLPESMGGQDAPTVTMPAPRPAAGGAEAMPPSGAALARPQAAPKAPVQQGSGMPAWMTPERKRIYDRAQKASGEYQRAVQQRRVGRREQRNFSKLMNSLEREEAIIQDSMALLGSGLFDKNAYPEHFNTLNRQITKHQLSAERLREKVDKERSRLEKSGISLDEDVEDQLDRQFDDRAGNFMSDLLLWNPTGSAMP